MTKGFESPGLAGTVTVAISAEILRHSMITYVRNYAYILTREGKHIKNTILLRTDTHLHTFFYSLF